MRTTKHVALITVLLVTLFTGCSQPEEQSRGLEQIHREDGLPVKTITIQQAPFSTWMNFNTTLRGIEQTNCNAGIGAEVESALSEIGDMVEKDQVIVTFPTDHPMAHYEQARVAFENATATLERLEGLYTEGGISEQEMDNVRLQQQIASLNWDMSRRTVEREAPISGHLTRLHVQPSDNVGPDDPLFTIARTDTMRVNVWLSEGEFLQIATDTPAELIWQGMSFSGSVSQLDQAFDNLNGGFRTTLLFANPDNTLKPGVTAELRIRTYHNPQALAIRYPYLANDPNAGEVVFLAQGNQAKQQPVTTGRRQGLQLEITAGLSAGDELITTGQQMLRDGDLIKRQTEGE